MSRDLPHRARLLAVALAAAAAACTAAPDLDLHVNHLNPAGGVATLGANVEVHGKGFLPRAVQSASGGPSSLDTTHRAWLDGVALEAVTWVDEGTLRVAIPAGLPLGPHALEVENALGRRTTLAAAWTTIQPAALSAAASLPATVASTGQALTLTIALRNAGGAAVQGVQVSVTPRGAGDVQVGPLPAPVDVPAGGAVEVTVPLTASRVGQVVLQATAWGSEAFTGGAVQAEAPAVVVKVEARAALTAALALPARVTAAGPFTVTMTVANPGEAAALGVAPGPLSLAAGVTAGLPTLGAPVPASADIPGGGSATFTWQAGLTSGGALALTGGAAGVDANDGATVVAPPATSSAVTPQPSAALTLQAELDRAVLFTGQKVRLHVTVRNTGPVAVDAITVAVGSTGAGALGEDTPVTPFALAPGDTFEDNLPFTALTAGKAAVSVSAAGREHVTGLPASASRAAGSVEILDRAALVASLAIPTTLPAGSAFTVTMTVFNLGGAAALAVRPGALTMTADGTGTLASLAGPTPAQADLPGQGSATFTWTARLQAGGTVELLGGAAGVDANDRGPVVAPPVESNVGGQAAEVSLVTVDPFGDGAAAGLLAVHSGRLWLGPSGDGKTLWQLDPATGQTAIMGVQISVDQGSSPASNTAWSPSQTADTFGRAECAENSTACGPSNETGRGLLAGGTVFGTDWLLYGGASPSKAQNLYLASGTTPAFWTVDLANALPSTSDGLTAAAFVDDGSAGGTLYLGISDKAGSRSPNLVALTRGPTSAWLDANSSQAVELGAEVMPVIGGSAMALRNANAQPRIDAMLQFRGLLYVASGNGLMRSTVARPRSYADHPEDWTYAGLGPVLPFDWPAKASVEAAGTSALTPADRGVPAMATFGACGAGPCLFVARNVKGTGAQPATVPQLWKCDPSRSSGGSTCDTLPSTWSLAVPNTSGDKALTQLGVATRGAVSVLLATSRYLYLGFDDATTGAQLFRTEVLPTTSSAFKGMDGCAAGAAGCSGLGGPGLGDATMTRFLSAEALTVGGKTTVYVLAAGASGAQRLYALPE